MKPFCKKKKKKNKKESSDCGKGSDGENMQHAYLFKDGSLSQGTRQGFLNCLGTSPSISDKWLEIRLECVSGVGHDDEAGVFDPRHLKENLTGIFFFPSGENASDHLV